MITYRLVRHTTRDNTFVVEVWMDKTLIGEIVEAEGSNRVTPHLRFISKYLADASVDFRIVGSVEIKLKPAFDGGK